MSTGPAGDVAPCAGAGPGGTAARAGFSGTLSCIGAAAASTASISRITVPSATLSPTFIRNSRTTPACGEGISIDALSDSSVTREPSFSTRSPGLTRISMTSTSLKSPMSGTLISMSWLMADSEQYAADIGQHRGEVRGKARSQGAVDDTVVVGQRERQHEARHELAVLVDGPHGGPRHTQNCHLRRVDDRSEGRAAYTAQARYGECPPLHVAGLQLLVARKLRYLGKLPREVEHALPVRIADHRHHQPVGCVDRNPDMVIALDDQVLARPV